MGKVYCFYQNYREVSTRHGDSPISAIISISHGTGSYIVADRSTRSGRTQPDGTTKVSVYVTREDSTNKAVQPIPGPTPSAVP